MEKRWIGGAAFLFSKGPSSRSAMRIGLPSYIWKDHLVMALRCFRPHQRGEKGSQTLAWCKRLLHYVCPQGTVRKNVGWELPVYEWCFASCTSVRMRYYRVPQQLYDLVLNHTNCSDVWHMNHSNKNLHGPSITCAGPPTNELGAAALQDVIKQLVLCWAEMQPVWIRHNPPDIFQPYSCTT